MDDPNRQPRDRDRDELIARIRRAADQGRIATADRDIRLANVASAQSMAELALMSRELDQLETALPSAPATGGAPVPVPAPTAGGVAEVVADVAGDAVRSAARSLLPVGAMAVAVVLIGGGAAVVFALRGLAGSSGPAIQLHDPLPPTSLSSDPATGSSADPTTGSSAGTTQEAAPFGSAYSLTGPGIRAFLRAYRARFATSQALDLTLYETYAIVQVPVTGTARHAGWLYRPGSGFTRFGGVATDFPGARLVDIDTLAVPALVRNIAKARDTLGVANPTQTYAIVRHFATSDPAPTVDIHVANELGESGYLATLLDGTVEHAYPFGPAATQ